MIFRIYVILCLLLLAACSGHTPDGRLVRVAGMVSESPRDALSALDSIDRGSLSEADRHYHDLLTIKANDKAYNPHTSDSLFLDVIDYYSSHRSTGLYPEALYYGGRVYSDLGDYPTALKYFQNTLDLLPRNTKDQELRARALSQTGRLLQNLYLFEDAIPYIKDVIEINRAMKDTTNLVYDLQLLGCTYLRAGNFTDAERYLRESLTLSEGRHANHASKARLYMAATKYQSDEIDSALYYFRKAPEMLRDSVVRDYAIAYGARIYLKAGIPDTAYMYALDLVTNNDRHNDYKEVGYDILLAPELRRYLSDEDLNICIDNYRTTLADYYDENQNQLAINQQSLYNYELHERAKNNAEREVSSMRRILIFYTLVSLLIISILIATSIYLKSKKKSNIIQLQQALNHLDKLKRELDILRQDSNLPADQTNDENGVPENTGNLKPEKPLSFTEMENQLREELKKGLMTLYENSDRLVTVSPIIINSDPYIRIQKYLQDSIIIPPDDPLWDELEKTVLSASPKFRYNLNLLTSGNLTTIDLYTALLIKCGIKPSKMETCTGRSHGAIVSRRETL